jgi:hypothetical protein
LGCFQSLHIFSLRLGVQPLLPLLHKPDHTGWAMFAVYVGISTREALVA